MSHHPTSGSSGLEGTLIFIAQAITQEVLLRQPDDLLDCCASFLERKLRQRDGYHVREEDRMLAKLRMSHLMDTEKTSCTAAYEHGDALSNSDKSPALDAHKLGDKSDTSESGDRSTNRKKHHVGSANTPMTRFSRKTKASGKKSKSDFPIFENDFDSLGIQEEYQSFTKEDTHRRLPPDVSDNEKSKRSDINGAQIRVVADVHAVDNELLTKKRTPSRTASRSDSCSAKASSEQDTSGCRKFSNGFYCEDDGDCATPEPAPRAPTSSPEHLMTLTGHRNVVTQCCVLERYIVSSSLDCTVRVWDREDGQSLDVLNCQRLVHCFQCVTVQDGEVVLFAALDTGKILGWKLITNDILETKLVAEYSGHLPNPIRAMDVSGDSETMATGCCFIVVPIKSKKSQRECVRGSVKVWDLSSMLNDCMKNDGHFMDKPPKCAKTMHQLMTHTLRPRAASISQGAMALEEAWWGIRALQFTPDASRLVVGFGHPDDEELYDEGLLVVCNALTLETLWTQDRRMCQVTSVHIQPTGLDESQDFDSVRMAVGTQNCLHNISLVLVGKKKVDIIYHWSKFLSEDHFGAQYSPQGDYVVSAVGSSIYFWDIHTGQKLKELSGHADQITFISHSSDGTTICSASDDHSLIVWEVPESLREVSNKDRRKISKRRSSELLAHGIARRNQKKTITY